jgi:hypothetical protein
MLDGGFAFSNLPLSPGLDVLAKNGKKPSAVLAMLSFPSNKENGGFAKYPAYLENRIFQTRKVLDQCLTWTGTSRPNWGNFESCDSQACQH